MTECDEVALSIWRARSVNEGTGLNVTLPIRSFDDALQVARHQMPDESETIITNVADALYRMAERAGTIKVTP